MEDFKFSTLEYKRPDFEKTGAFAEEITEKIKNAASYGELKGYMEQMEEMSKNFSTDCTIASIRHTLDTTDEFYEKEDAYINDMVPTVMPKNPDACSHFMPKRQPKAACPGTTTHGFRSAAISKPTGITTACSGRPGRSSF